MADAGNNKENVHRKYKFYRTGPGQPLARLLT